MPTRSDLAKIHIAKKELGLSDELYRGFLSILFGKSSAKYLNPVEVSELLIHFRSLGWQPTYNGGQVAHLPSHLKPSKPPRFSATVVEESTTPKGSKGIGKIFSGFSLKRACKEPETPPKKSRKKKYDELGFRRGMASPAQLRMIEYFWMTGKGVRNKNPEALRHFLKHYFHVTALRFIRANQVTSILGAIRRISSEHS